MGRLYPCILCIFGIVAFACRPAPPNWARYDIGGMYHFEIERVGNFDTSVKFEFKSEGAEQREFVEIVSDGKTIRIENGKLSVNGKDAGRVQKKDRIMIKRDGAVLVNGKKR